jgi:hypothetical protein
MRNDSINSINFDLCIIPGVSRDKLEKIRQFCNALPGSRDTIHFILKVQLLIENILKFLVERETEDCFLFKEAYSKEFRYMDWLRFAKMLHDRSPHKINGGFWFYARDLNKLRNDISHDIDHINDEKSLYDRLSRITDRAFSYSMMKDKYMNTTSSVESMGRSFSDPVKELTITILSAFISQMSIEKHLEIIESLPGGHCTIEARRDGTVKIHQKAESPPLG